MERRKHPQQAPGKGATIEGLTDGQSYALRVRSRLGQQVSDWSDTVHATPTPDATLIQEFDDLTMANSSVQTLDMA